MRIVIVLVAALLVVSPMLTPAVAQEISEAREGNAWIGYVVAAVLTLAVGVVSFMGAKRTHEDT
ncbi:MAG: hypothetical protein AAF328_04175 [Planctomycetota bacterium]